jgi:tetratricopeptide (TPR) repeat protein
MSFSFSLPEKPPKTGTPVTAEQAEQLLLKQLETHQRPEEQVLWDLVKLYSQTDRLTEAITQVAKLVAIADTAEKKAACYLAMDCMMEKRLDFEAAIKCYADAMALEPASGHTSYFIRGIDMTPPDATPCGVRGC